MLFGKLARFHHIGDGIDPFVVLPQFQHPQLNALHLTRTCKLVESTSEAVSTRPEEMVESGR
jgi:hypothetical protein